MLGDSAFASTVRGFLAARTSSSCEAKWLSLSMGTIGTDGAFRRGVKGSPRTGSKRSREIAIATN
jgi:hypothetical protein